MPGLQQYFRIHTAATVPPQRLTQNSREYLVSPCVMIVEGVLNQALVPGDEIRACAWDGISLTINHPTAPDGTPISARSPDVPSVGRVYRTHYSTFQRHHQTLTRAAAELWIDVAQAQAMGGEAVQAITMLEAQHPLEVSTAFYSEAEQTPGTFQGLSYLEVHRNLLADHLALLPNSMGACDFQMGCGAPRICAQSCTCHHEGTPMEQRPAQKPRGLVARVKHWLQREEAALVTHQTDVDIRQALYSALARELGVDATMIFIEALDIPSQTFTFSQGERLMQRSWSVEDGQIVLTDGAQDVQRSTTYTPVTQEQEEAPMPASEAVKTRVTALIASDPRWKESDRPQLETMSEAQLALVETTAADQARLQQYDTRKQAAITALVAAKYPLSADRLNALDLDELEQLVPLTTAQEPSYAGQGLPALRQQADGEESWMPKSILAKIDVPHKK